MARFAFAWEMGSNYGHISGFAPVATELERRGHEVVAILQNVHDARHFFGKNVRILQAPHCLDRRKEGTPPPQVTFADLIRRLGYSDPKELAMLLRVWRSALEIADPAFVLYDAAPTAMLASRGLTFGKATIGAAFAVPPRVRPLPLLNSRMKVPFAEHEQREASVVKVINQALAELELGQIEALRDLLDADFDLIRAVPELDHYAGRKGGEYVGSGFSLDGGVQLDFPPGDGPKIFMYLRSTMRIEPLLKQAAAMPVRILAVVPEMQQGVTGRTPPNLRLSKDPAKLRNIVATADLAVCNSATGTGAAFLMGGVPLLVIPTSIEQIMVALRVQDQGMGLAVADGPNANYQVAIQRLLREPGFREAARAFAKKYSGFQSSNAAAICDRLELALERPRELAAVAP